MVRLQGKVPTRRRWSEGKLLSDQQVPQIFGSFPPTQLIKPRTAKIHWFVLAEFLILFEWSGYTSTDEVII